MTTSYDHDAAGQLTSVTGPAGTNTYTYDELGRRTSKSVAGAVTDYHYDDADQLTSTTGVGATTYTWDDAGRMLTSKTGATTTYSYDPAGRLVSVKRGSTTMARTLDGDGRLVSVVNQGGQPHPARLGHHPSRARTGVDDHPPGNKAHTLAGVDGRTSAFRAGDDSEAIPVDVHGSALETSATSLLAAGAGYDEFGNPTTTVGFADVRLGYRGELTEHRHLHLRARQYNPDTGSFTTPDPRYGINGTPTLTNPYHYADKRPTQQNRPARPTTRRFGCWLQATGAESAVPSWCGPGVLGVRVPLEPWA